MVQHHDRGSRVRVEAGEGAEVGAGAEVEVEAERQVTNIGDAPFLMRITENKHVSSR